MREGDALPASSGATAISLEKRSFEVFGLRLHDVFGAFGHKLLLRCSVDGLGLAAKLYTMRQCLRIRGPPWPTPWSSPRCLPPQGRGAAVAGPRQGPGPQPPCSPQPSPTRSCVGLAAGPSLPHPPQRLQSPPHAATTRYSHPNFSGTRRRRVRLHFQTKTSRVRFSLPSRLIADNVCLPH